MTLALVQIPSFRRRSKAIRSDGTLASPVASAMSNLSDHAYTADLSSRIAAGR